MAEKKGLEKQVPNNVVSLGSQKCLADDCKAKPSRANFCSEHFDWFKLGLISKDGHRVPDFDKKFYHYEAGKKKVA